MSSIQGNPLEPSIGDGVEDAGKLDGGRSESQGRIVLRRFMANRLAVVALIVYILIIIFSISSIYSSNNRLNSFSSAV